MLYKHDMMLIKIDYLLQKRKHRGRMIDQSIINQSINQSISIHITESLSYSKNTRTVLFQKPTGWARKLGHSVV